MRSDSIHEHISSLVEIILRVFLNSKSHSEEIWSQFSESPLTNIRTLIPLSVVQRQILCFKSYSNKSNKIDSHYDSSYFQSHFLLLGEEKHSIIQNHYIQKFPRSISISAVNFLYVCHIRINDYKCNL